MKFWNREVETMSRDALEALQLKGLQKTLRRVWGCEWWRDLLHKRGMSDPEDVKSLDDLRNLPFLTKEDFREAYPLKMSTVDRKELLEFHMSSGSTGTPVVMAYTKNDLNQWADTMARCFTMAGLEAGDAFQIMPTFGLFNGGFGCYHGCRKMGLFCVPASSGNTERQIKLMRDFRVKGFCSVVSYVPRIIEKLDASNDPDIPSLRVGVFGSETFSDEMRKKIENRLHIECFDIYGMTETGGIGTTGQDCSAHAGIHVWDDYYITEVIDPATGKNVPDGEYGEVVFTSLAREAMPIIRYRTHDISRIPLAREVRVRAHAHPHRPHHGPYGRHADRQGRQFLSASGRTGAHGDSGREGRVPDHPRGAQRHDGRDDQRRGRAWRDRSHGGQTPPRAPRLPPQG